MKRLTLLMLAFAVFVAATACTSMIVTAEASATGRPLLWKHRDTGADNNFMQRVERTDSSAMYVGLFNAGDSTLAEAWMGMNEYGFAIMNTASYNLAPDTAKIQDQEGRVMTAALGRCHTVDDFERLLAQLPKPLGVQANFGVIDASGGAAYFETSDWEWKRLDIDPGDLMIETNYSTTGIEGKGHGYARANTAWWSTVNHQTGETNLVSPADLTENLSRNLINKDKDIFIIPDDEYDTVRPAVVKYEDFIPRRISTASIVIEGVNSPDDSAFIRAWAAPGFPPLSWVSEVTLTHIPDRWLPGADWRSPGSDDASQYLNQVFIGDGKKNDTYINVERLGQLMRERNCREKSKEAYKALNYVVTE